MIKLLLVLFALPAAAYAFLPAAALVGAAGASGPLAPVVLGGAGLAGLFMKLFGGGSKTPSYSPPMDPYTGQVMAIDPKTGLNQRVIDKLWSYNPQGMNWAGDAASFTDAQSGLPKWLVSRLNLASLYGANWMGFFKDNQTFDGNLPPELEWLLTVPWGTLASDYEFGDLAPATPPSEGVQGGTPEALNQPQINEGQEVSYPEGQQPDMTSGEPTFSTTTYGAPQIIPPELIAAASGAAGGALLANQLGGQSLPGAGVQGPGFTSNLSPVQEPNTNQVPDYVSPPIFTVDVWGNPISETQGIPPNIIGDVPWFYGQGTATGDPVPTQPVPISGQLTPPPLPGAGVSTISMPIGGTPTTTTPNVTPTAPTPQLPEIPNIPIGGGGGGAALPPGFPVVGGGPMIQTVFGPIPLPQGPPSIVDFLRRR